MPWQCEAGGISLALVVGRGWSRRLMSAGTIPPSPFFILSGQG